MSASSLKVAVYGLSTEGYRIASHISNKGIPVSIIDDSSGMAITLKQDIAKTYSSVTSFIQDETLLDFEPFDVAVNNASFIFFTPRIRKSWPDAKNHIGSKFQDVIKHVNKDSSIINTVPTGFGANNEYITLIEHRTGLNVGKNIFYHYMPISSISSTVFDAIIGTRSEVNPNLESMLSQLYPYNTLKVVDIESAEYFYCIGILRHYGLMSPIFEICKFADSSFQSQMIESQSFDDLYLDDLVSGLFDLNTILSSLAGISPLTLLLKGNIATVENYIKYLTEQIKIILKKYELKASKTKAIISWTFDPNEMRGDRLEIISRLESRLKDYVGDVERQDSMFDFYSSEKKLIVVSCSKPDFERITKNNPNSEIIIVKATPLLGQSRLQS
ncbi:MAG TPA: hypothetical protein VFY55_05600 [Nitrososphaeraceae archaeon]|nr:hypothetical protein [Nitrososphaeraceae archaeon]